MERLCSLLVHERKEYFMDFSDFDDMDPMDLLNPIEIINDTLARLSGFDSAIALKIMEHPAMRAGVASALGGTGLKATWEKVEGEEPTIKLIISKEDVNQQR